jgi:hypothetical protein
MSDIPCSTPAITAWSEGDGERAFHALQQVFDDLDWAEPGIRLRQNRLVEELRQRGIGRALAAALIEDLLARKVFRGGASFVDLNTFVRLDGYQTDTSTPNRFLHTTRDSWFRHLAGRQAQRRAGPRSRPRLRRMLRGNGLRWPKPSESPGSTAG